jgi:hypothetical protein
MNDCTKVLAEMAARSLTERQASDLREVAQNALLEAEGNSALKYMGLTALDEGVWVLTDAGAAIAAALEEKARREAEQPKYQVLRFSTDLAAQALQKKVDGLRGPRAFSCWEDVTTAPGERVRLVFSDMQEEPLIPEQVAAMREAVNTLIEELPEGDRPSWEEWSGY